MDKSAATESTPNAVSHEWATTLVVSHCAGSLEGAIYQRLAMRRAVESLDGCEIVAASTERGSAAGKGLRLLLGIERDIGEK